MKQALLLLFTFLSITFSSKSQDTKSHSVLFDLEKDEISEEQNTLLQNWISSIDDTAKRMEVIGHADFLGSTITILPYRKEEPIPLFPS